MEYLVTTFWLSFFLMGIIIFLNVCVAYINDDFELDSWFSQKSITITAWLIRVFLITGFIITVVFLT